MTQWKFVRSGGRLCTVQLAAMASAVLGMVAAPTTARATLIDYVFNDNGGLQYNNGSQILSVFLTGDFTYDTVANALTAVDVTLSGGGTFRPFGTYTTLANTSVNGPTDVQLGGPDSSPVGAISFRLSQVLGTTGRVDLLPGWLGWNAGPPISTSFFPFFADPANPPFVSGTEVAEASVPEPASLLVVGVGCTLLAGWRRWASVRGVVTTRPQLTKRPSWYA